jgi:glucan-binding YG repeat protein
MDDLKRPGSILSLFNTVYLIGSTIFFYKKIKEMNVKIDDFSNLVNNTINVTTQLRGVEQILERQKQFIIELNNRNAKLEKNIKKIQKILKKNGLSARKYESSDDDDTSEDSSKESSDESSDESSEEEKKSRSKNKDKGKKKSNKRKKKKNVSINDLGI